MSISLSAREVPIVGNRERKNAGHDGNELSSDEGVKHSPARDHSYLSNSIVYSSLNDCNQLRPHRHRHRRRTRSPLDSRVKKQILARIGMMNDRGDAESHLCFAYRVEQLESKLQPPGASECSSLTDQDDNLQ